MWPSSSFVRARVNREVILSFAAAVFSAPGVPIAAAVAVASAFGGAEPAPMVGSGGLDGFDGVEMSGAPAPGGGPGDVEGTNGGAVPAEYAGVVVAPEETKGGATLVGDA